MLHQREASQMCGRLLCRDRDVDLTGNLLQGEKKEEEKRIKVTVTKP